MENTPQNFFRPFHKQKITSRSALLSTSFYHALRPHHLATRHLHFDSDSITPCIQIISTNSTLALWFRIHCLIAYYLRCKRSKLPLSVLSHGVYRRCIDEFNLRHDLWQWGCDRNQCGAQYTWNVWQKESFLAVNIWLLDFEKGFTRTQIINPNTLISNESSYYSLLSLKEHGSGKVVSRDFRPKGAGNVKYFYREGNAKFVSWEHEKRACDQLHQQFQTNSVSQYISEIRTITLAIVDMCNEERMEIFIDGLKSLIPIKVLKSQIKKFGGCTRTALNINRSIRWAGKRPYVKQLSDS